MNSFDIDGSFSKLCAGSIAGAGEAGAGGGGAGEAAEGSGLWGPNVYLGSPIDAAVMVAPTSGTRFPAIVLGTDDFAIEFWANFFGYANFNNDDSMGIGFVGSGVGPFAFLSFVGGSSPIRPQFADGVGTANGGFLAVPRGWHHWNINYDKSGNMVTYLDGTAVDTTAISGRASSMGTRNFHPLAFSTSGTVGDITNADSGYDLAPSTDPGGSYPESLTDPFTNYNFFRLPCGIGPVALHVGALLTDTQRADSLTRRSVQNIANRTQVLYRWKNIVFDSGHSWDFNRRHAFRGITDWTPNPVGIPRGADSSVRVLNTANTSGVDPLRLQTTEVYGQNVISSLTAVQDGLKGWHAFATDPFFTTGGGVAPGL